MSTSNRRTFLQTSAAAGGGLIVQFFLPSELLLAAKEATPFLNAWLRIDTKNVATFFLDKCEMGQGVYTALPTILAEELDLNPARLNIEFAPADPRYANAAFGMQLTGGSTSVRSSWKPLKEAGATARLMLLQAAANAWNVSPKDLRTADGEIFHDASNKKATYGEFASAAAKLTPPKPTFKDPKDYKYVGKKVPRLDAPAKSAGTALFGLDATPAASHLVAVLIRPPVWGAKLKSFKLNDGYSPTPTALLETPRGVAVVAPSYWLAKKAAEATKTEWDEGPLKDLSSEKIWQDMAALAKNTEGKKSLHRGDAKTTLANAKRKVLQSIYQMPYLAHACMEPMNCTVSITSSECEMWVPTQSAGFALDIAASMTGLSKEKIKINSTFCGGGFGRRSCHDFIAEALEVGMRIKRPVKLMWTREDDMKFGYFRPISYQTVSASLDDSGALTSWEHKIVSPSIMAQFIPNAMPSILPSWVPGFLTSTLGSAASYAFKNFLTDDSAVEGIADTTYDIPNVDVRYVAHDPGVPIWFWRSVGHSQNAFVMESFIDEMAHLAGQDPYHFRRKLLQKDTRKLGVLDLAAQKAGWGTPTKPGVFRGIACHTAFATFVAQVVEATVENNQIRVRRVVCAVDCGAAVSPDGIKAQMESSIIYGLSAALYGEITVKNGRVQQSNFHDYQMLRMNEAPEIEVLVVASQNDPGGVGEPGLPPVAPALANAVFAATGKRLRKLPLQLT